MLIIFLYFLNHLNIPTCFANISKYQNITFIAEHENTGALSLLNVKVYRNNTKFATSTCRKPAIQLSRTSAFTNYGNFIQTYQKTGPLHTSLHRKFSIFCDLKTFYLEINHLMTILRKNNYPPSFTDLCIKSFLNKLYISKVIVQNVPDRDVFVKLPFLGSISFQIRKKLQKYLLIN